MNNTNYLRLGTKIFYTGDMANASGHFEVVSKSGSYCDLKELPGGQNRLFRGIPIPMIGFVYHGHCNPRFVTEEAVNAFRAAQTRILRSQR